MKVTDWYAQSTLSEASYVDFRSALLSDGSYDDDLVRNALTNTRFSETQAASLVLHWKVAHHYPDDSAGFSATLFDSLDRPGTYTLAIRGTRGSVDLLAADALGIVTLGYARDQVYSLYNYFLRLITPVFDTVGQWIATGDFGFEDGNYVSLYEYQNDAVSGLGVIVDDTGQATNFDAKIQVSGHSLGGHLAFAFSRLFPEWTESLYTYNAPGIGESTAVDTFFSSFGGSGAYPDDLAQRTTSIVGAAGRELIAGFNGSPVTEQFIFIEDQGLPGSVNLAGNHSIDIITDALAVYNLMSVLDPNLTVEQITPYFELASDQPAASLESLVMALDEVFNVGSGTVISDREQLYQHIKAIEADAFYQQASGLLSIVATATLEDDADLDTTAGLAYRYALEHLNAFAINGDGALYASHNAGGELNAENFTAAYLSDRAAFLNLKNQLYQQDRDFLTNTGEDIRYQEGDLTLEQHKITPGRSGTPRLVIFGTGDADPLIIGGTEDDRIYGRMGNDVLQGGSGDDYLEGGRGDDVYIFEAGDDTDTIFDSDGVGRIVLRSGGSDSTLGGVINSVPGQDNVFKDADGNIFKKEGEDLRITPVLGGHIRVKSFTDGMLGIGLNAVPLPPAPEAPSGIAAFELGQFGSQAYSISPVAQPATENPNYGLQWYLDPYRTEIIYAEGADHPAVSPGEDWITGQVAGGMGHSYLFGDAGFDYLIDDTRYQSGPLEGGSFEWLLSDPTWEPLLEAGAYFPLGYPAGNDVMYGGAGNDWLFSHGGDDWLFGGDGDDLLLDNPGLAFGDDRWLALPGASSDDRLSGGNGNDVLISLQGEDLHDGGEGNDVLLSGQGNDNLTGGGGNDWILADATISRHEFVLQPDDSYKLTLEADEAVTGYGNDTLFGDAGNDVLAGGGGDDWLSGGAENDTLWGDGSSRITDVGAIEVSVGDGAIAGNDTLFGEAGDDVLIGGGGDDYLDSGDGNDQLEGDHADLALADHGDDTLFGGAGDDSLAGQGGDDTLYGDAGQDQLWGDEGNDGLFGDAGADVLNGGAGNDFVSGGADNDELLGGDGDDSLFGDGGADRFNGGNGNDVLYGGTGDDEIYGAAGDDMLAGGSGVDSLFGGEGDDTYRVNIGDAETIIVDTKGSNSLLFGPGVSRDSLNLLEIQADDGARYLAIEYGSSGDRVFVKNGPLGTIRSFEFADGMVLTVAQFLAQADISLTGEGTPDDDLIVGGDDADQLKGAAGNDQIQGGAGNDQIEGGTGDDALDGEFGDDMLDGGVGNDTLRGGAGVDSYRLDRGMGRDLVIEEGTEHSILRLGNAVALSDLLFNRDQDDLLVQLNGVLGEGVRIRNFATPGQTWEIAAADGSVTLLDDDLIDATASGVVSDAASAMARYEADIGSLYRAKLNARGSSPGEDGIYRRTQVTSSGYSVTTEIFADQFLILDQSSDAVVIARTSSPQQFSRIVAGQETLSGAVLNTLAGRASLDTDGGTFTSASGGATPVPPGATLVNVLARPQDIEGDIDAGYGDYTVPLGYWTFAAGSGGASGPGGLQYQGFQHTIFQSASVITLERITAGDSDNLIDTSGYSIVDAGAGNDKVSAGARASVLIDESNSIDPVRFNRPYDQTWHQGALLYGNAGDDEVRGGEGNDVLIGGEGADFLDGRVGEDTYFVFASDTGWDLIADSAGQAAHIETFSTRYKDWYYQSAGLPDWYEREVAGQTLPELPLPAANDYAALEQLSQLGVIETDRVEFGAGISLSDLTLSWGEVLLPGSVEQAEEAGYRTVYGYGGIINESLTWQDIGSVHMALTISWAPDAGVRILMPHSAMMIEQLPPEDPDDNSQTVEKNARDRFLGMGIEQFRFADGVLLSMKEMLALAPPAPDFDPHVGNNVMQGTAGDDWLIGWRGNDTIRGGAGSDAYIFNIGDGVDTILDDALDGDSNSIRFGNGISSADISVTRSSDEVIIKVGTNGDAIHLRNPDTVNGDPTDVITSLQFTGEDEIMLADLVALDAVGEHIVGTNGNDTLTGTAGSDTIDGLGGNDTINGADGDDVIIGGAGRDTLDGGAGDDVFLVEGTHRSFDTFNGDAGTDSILGGIGDDTIRLRSFAANNSVEVIDGGAGFNVIAGTGGYDTIDLSATSVSNIDRIDAGAGNDLVIGTDNADLIIGGAGRDTLNGGAGDDIFLVGGTHRSFDSFNGDAGTDSILGGSGDDTIRLRSFAANNSVEVIDGGAGFNVIAGTGGHDTIDLSATSVSNIDRIDAGAGNDTVVGTDNADLIIGGAGRDMLNGGMGDDTYLYDRGDGKDLIVDSDSGSSNNDKIALGASIRHDQLWFSQDGNDLSVQVIGTTDRLQIKDWYLGSQHQIEIFDAADGFILLNSQVDQLVQAMAGFAAPANGELDLSADLRDQLEPVIAAAWR